MQRGKHKVAGESGFNSNFCCLKVADFAHQDDVRVLPQEGAQRGGKVQSDLLLHLYLVHARELEFDGIFRGHNVRIGCVQARDR